MRRRRERRRGRSPKTEAHKTEGKKRILGEFFPCFLRTLVLKVFFTAKIQYDGLGSIIFHVYIQLCMCGGVLWRVCVCV